MEPTLAGQYCGGYFTETYSTGGIHSFTIGLAAAAQLLGVKIQYDQQALVTAAGEVGEREIHTFDSMVLCAVVARRDLTVQLGVRVNIYPVKGYSITVNLNDAQSQAGSGPVGQLGEASRQAFFSRINMTEEGYPGFASVIGAARR